MNRAAGHTRAGTRGYTMIEVMIALTLLAVGTSGVIAMQKVTAVANRDAKTLVVATQVARTWLERLRADATQWNHPSLTSDVSDMADTRWLKAVNGVWFRPTDDVAGSPTADALGNDVRDTDIANGAFCSNVRLTWLYGPPSSTLPPPYLIRAEVRVYWLRQGAGGSIEAGKTICDPSIDLSKISPSVDRYHFVYLTSALAQNMAR
jgi:type IV pilus assembly protein PilV